MLRWALIFFIFSLVAGLFGFGGIASSSAGMAQTIFYIFIILFVLSLFTGMFRGNGKIGRNL
jgi:uncharacterized membrane protein YtjA (UPF0391 family)